MQTAVPANSEAATCQPEGPPGSHEGGWPGIEAALCSAAGKRGVQAAAEPQRPVDLPCVHFCEWIFTGLHEFLIHVFSSPPMPQLFQSSCRSVLT